MPLVLQQAPGFDRFGVRAINPTLAFFLLTIAAIFAFTNSLTLVGIDSFRLLGYLGTSSLTSGQRIDFVVCSLFSVAFGVIILVGAFSILRRRSYALGVLAAVLALGTLGPCGVNVMLGLIALVLVMSSREQFSNTDQQGDAGRPASSSDNGN